MSTEKARVTLSMDNDWRFHRGDVSTAAEKGHAALYDFTKAGGIGGPARADWNDDGWELVQLPHDWVVGCDFNSDESASQGCKPRGIGWYRKLFHLDEADRGKQILLEFDGIATYAKVYFNGSEIAQNWCGYTSFAVDISDRVFWGSRVNTLAVRVDAEAWEGWWYEGAGIYRHVRLTKKAQVHIAHWGVWVNSKKLSEENAIEPGDVNLKKPGDVNLKKPGDMNLKRLGEENLAKPGEKDLKKLQEKDLKRPEGEIFRWSDGNVWSTEIETTVENSSYESASFRLVSTILDPDGKIAGRAESEAVCQSLEKCVLNQSIRLDNPEIWDIDSPKLYILMSEVYCNGILVDNDETAYGYRTIGICPDTGFYLNGRPLKIKGTCNHQDHAGIGVALPDSIHEYRIRRLKEMGSNAYRCAHGNPAKELLDACDRLGMLVMDENRRFESSEEGIRQVESMVRRDRNHPCIIMYSIFNEEPLQGTPQGRAMAMRLIHTIKRLDSSRPVTAAMNGGLLQDEGVADVLDISGFNYNLQEYDAFHAKHPHQPVIGTENNCAFSTRGVYASDSKRQVFSCYDEEKASWGHTIRETWKAVNTRSFVMGLFVWTGFDYRGEPSPYGWPSISSHWGVMDTCGFAKDAFYLLKACWTEEPMIHVLPHWNWKGMEGVPIKVMSHTNCSEVELFLNGRSLGRKPSAIYEQAVWEMPYEPGILMLKGYADSITEVADITETTGEAVALRLEPDRGYLFGDGHDAIPVNICAVDYKGRFVPTADNKVSLTVSGPAKVIGMGNGDPNCHEPDAAQERSLFSVRCQAVLQSIHDMRVNQELQGRQDMQSMNGIQCVSGIQSMNGIQGMRSMQSGQDISCSCERGKVLIRAEADGLEPAELVIEVRPKEPAAFVQSVFERHITGWRMTQNLFEERPDPGMAAEDWDMNTWEPVEFDDSPQSKFNGRLGCYALYRARFRIPDAASSESMSLKFYKVMGFVEVYVNGDKLAEEDCMWGRELVVPLAPDMRGDAEITVSIKCNNSGWPFAGICNSVVIK